MELSDGEKAEACRLVLVNWIAGWPDVRDWRFEVDWVEEWDAVEVVTARLTEDRQIWKVRDLIPWKLCGQSYNEVHRFVEFRAGTRHAELTQTITLVQGA